MENNDTLREISFKRKLFGGEIEIVFYNIENSKAEKIIEKTYREALRLQKIFNFYDKESELSILNRKRKLKVSYELLEVITKAIIMSEKTRGEYDVALGRSILDRKNGKKMDKIKSLYKYIKIDGNNIVLTNPEALIDLGSIAKGYITDKIAEFLRINGVKDFLIDSRGDILFSGNINHVIPVQHPRNKDGIICNIMVNNEGVATSGDYNQFYDDFDNSHILNKKEIISATVVAQNLDEADLYATALVVVNEKERKKLISENKEIKVMLITKNLEKQHHNGFEELIYEN